MGHIHTINKKHSSLKECFLFSLLSEDLFTKKPWLYGEFVDAILTPAGRLRI